MTTSLDITATIGGVASGATIAPLVTTREIKVDPLLRYSVHLRARSLYMAQAGGTMDEPPEFPIEEVCSGGGQPDGRCSLSLDQPEAARY